MAANYEATLRLTSFIDARVQELEDSNGNMEECVVIPLEKNGLRFTNKNHVACKLFVTERMSPSKYGETHYIKMKTNKEHVAKMDSLGYTNPYLGEMHPTHYHKKFQDVYANLYGGKVSTEIINED